MINKKNKKNYNHQNKIVPKKKFTSMVTEKY